MDEIRIGERLNELEKKVDAIYVSVEKTRTYFLTVLIVSVIAFVLPLIGIIFAVPTFISTMSQLDTLQEF